MRLGLTNRGFAGAAIAHRSMFWQVYCKVFFANWTRAHFSVYWYLSSQASISGCNQLGSWTLEIGQRRENYGSLVQFRISPVRLIFELPCNILVISRPSTAEGQLSSAQKNPHHVSTNGSSRSGLTLYVKTLFSSHQHI